MLVEKLNNQTNFEGNFIPIGKFSRKNKLNLKHAQELIEDRIMFAPFNVFVKESKSKNIIMAANIDFKNAHLVHENYGYAVSTKSPSAYAYVDTYERMQSLITNEIKKENLLGKIKYFLGLKKFEG